jgi:hypothetical protein
MGQRGKIYLKKRLSAVIAAVPKYQFQILTGFAGSGRSDRSA